MDDAVVVSFPTCRKLTIILANMHVLQKVSENLLIVVYLVYGDEIIAMMNMRPGEHNRLLRKI